MAAQQGALTRRASFWIGCALAALFALGGLATGPAGAVMLLGFFVCISALWGAITGRTWLGRTPRLRSVIAAGIALVVFVGSAPFVDVAEGEDPAPVASPTASPTRTLTPTPTPTPSPAASPTPTPTTTVSPTPAPEAPAGAALAVAQQLTVKGRAPKTGYERDLFGSGWKDPDRNGCDARNDILARDLTEASYRPGTNDCVVLSGVLADPFSGSVIRFERGQSTSSLVQIDHVVALSDAWQKGAQGWTDAQRELFANDPLNLLAVDGSLNAQKGDGDAATWLPPNRAFRCAYVARQVAVKHAYGVWVTQAEQDAMVRVLSTCPDEPLPTGGEVTPGAPFAQAPAPEPDPVPAPEPEPAPAPDDVYYENCTAVREAGAAPLHRGEPGYATPRLDRDGDGIACE